MRRSERLFQIIQILRTAPQPVTAKTLAGEFELSTRTIYRDILELQYQNIPIWGEAGRGYTLDKSYNLPPMTFTPEELEAMILGAHWVAQRGDSALSKSALSLISKVQSVIPKEHLPLILEKKLFSASRPVKNDQHLNLKKIRLWIRLEKKLKIRYQKTSETNTRIVWPLTLVYFESSKLLVAWCETRSAYRHFRTDRILDTEFLEHPIPEDTQLLFYNWKKHEAEKGYQI